MCNLSWTPYYNLDQRLQINERPLTFDDAPKGWVAVKFRVEGQTNFRFILLTTTASCSDQVHCIIYWSYYEVNCIGRFMFTNMWRHFHTCAVHWLAKEQQPPAFTGKTRATCSPTHWSKYTNILNPTLREDRPVEVWQIVRSVLGLKKRQDEL